MRNRLEQGSPNHKGKPMVSARKYFIGCAFLFLFFSMFFPNISGADNIYFLESEIREIQRRIDPIADSIVKMEAFLQSCPERRKELETVYIEFQELEKKLARILSQNLIKSTISLGFETVGKIAAAADLVGNSLSRISIGIAMEVGGDMIKESVTKPYTRSVNKLGAQCAEILPELRKFQWELSLTSAEWSGYMRASGEFGDDDTTGILYRRFQYSLEGLRKYKKRVDEIISELKAAKEKIEAELPALYKENEALVKRKGELQTRLIAALDEQKRADMEARIEEAKKKAGEGELPELPPINVTGKWEEDYKVWSKKFDEAAVTFRRELPGLASDVIKRREEIDKRTRELDQSPETRKVSGIFQVPEPENPENDIYLQVIVQKHRDAKNGEEYYKSVQSAMPSVRGELQSIRQDALDLLVQEKRLNEFIDQGDQIHGEWRKIAGDGIDTQRSIFRLFSELIPNFVNFDKRLTGFRVIEQMTARDSDLGRKEELLPLAIEISQKNEQTLRKMFDAKMRTYNAQVAFIKETNTNMENAFAQLEGACEAYENLVSGTPWSARRTSPQSEFYASPYTGGPRYVLSKVFSPETFTNQLIDALGNGDFRFAVDLVEKYRQFQTKAESLNSQYTKALAHFKYYASVLRSTNLSIIQDMSAASRVEAAILKVPPITEKDWGISYGGFTRYLVCFRTVPELPPAELPPTSQGGKALSLFNVWNTIEKEGSSWTSLDKESFVKKTAELTKQIDEISKDERLKAPAGNVLEALGRIRDEWNTRNVDPGKSGPAGDSGGKDSGLSGPGTGGGSAGGSPVLSGFYTLYDARLNTHDLRDVTGGQVILTAADLRSGNIEVTARLSTVERIQTLLVSEDAGRTWTEIQVNRDLFYRFSPMAEKPYQIMLKIKTVDSQEAVIPFFPGVVTIIYRNISYLDLVQEAVVKIANAYESQSVADFASLISREYLGNRVFLEEGVRFDFDMFTDIRLKIFIDRIEQRGDLYVAETHWEKSQSPRKTGLQQMTTGKTVMIFSLEEGQLKIRNLRGNLIYATLSPEIAESSGLPQTVVDEIRVAKIERNPVQPGAGDVKNSGGASSFEIKTGTFTLTQRDVHFNNNGWAQGFSFASYQVSDLPAGPDIVEDFVKWDGNLGVKAGNGIVLIGAVDINSVAEAPAAGYANQVQPVSEQTCAIRLSDGTYALVQPTAWNWGVPLPYTTTFRYKHQKNGTRSFR